MAYMHRELWKWHWILFLVIINMVMQLQNVKATSPQVPCYFVFGASQYDVGNNNYLATMKVNYFPYGIDFPFGPTGRFSNGRNMADVIGLHLGFSYSTPAFAIAKGDSVLRGVNYASGGSGIRNETGKILGNVFTMDEQLKNHGTTIKKISNILGSEELTSDLLSKCIYTVNGGTNDYISNYFVPEFYNTSKQFNPEQYAEVVVQQYSQQLKRLYDYGARKVALMGLSRIGCYPFILSRFDRKGSPCVDHVNEAAELFNNRLISLVKDFNANFPGAKFTYINIFGIMSQDFSKLGFKVTNRSCCVVTKARCVALLPPCQNRKEYLFWDAVHSTEAANMVVGQRAYDATSPTDAIPYDIKTLAQLQIQSNKTK